VAGGLRKLGGTFGDQGAYGASGTLAGITGPGKRTVTSLELRRMGADENLSVLASFTQLERLELSHMNGVGLSPLVGLGVKSLTILDSVGLDLRPLAQLPALEFLVLGNLDGCVSPTALSPTLVLLVVINDDPALTGQPLREFVEAIDWTGLPALRSLSLRVGGLYEMPPVEVDLGFLRSLPALERLDAVTGLRHSGPDPSPLEPPFAGLSKQLTVVRIEAWDPAPVRAALHRYLGSDPDDVESGLSVMQRYAFEEPEQPWTIRAHDGNWLTYGSFFREEAGAHDDTEYDALRRAKARLRAADAALLRRLDFDPESAGTGVSAARREDLESALRTLGLTA
jgi:hypothetical protein